MSATSAAVAESKSESLSAKQARILDYLTEHAGTQTYFKSRLIGEELEMSAKEVGTNMTKLTEGEYGITVEKWGYSSSTTWKVTA